MLYEIGADGMKPITVEGKNDLKPGRVLHLNGYNNPNYVIVKNLGINPKSTDYGAQYLIVSLEDLGQSRKEAYTLKFINEKKDNRIQTYIMDETKTTDEVIDLWERSEAKRLRMEDAQKKATNDADRLEALGRVLFKRHVPDDAQALIVAVREIDQSDGMTDYFATKDGETVILGWSAHKRDLFSEMRKHAVKIPETAHMGPGMGHFTARVIIAASFQSNGRYYHEGERSHWHMVAAPPRIFRTHKAAEAFIAAQAALEPIHFDGVPVDFKWDIEEGKIEHREKYSMGAGYYIKDGSRYSTNWKVEKSTKYGADWGRGLYIAMAKRCIFEKGESKNGKT